MSRGIRAAAILAVVIGAAVAIVLGVFQIRSIDIRGNERYSAQQIRDDLIYDFKTRNTLYFAWKYRSEGPSQDAPYLKSVQATMLSPTSVRIVVKENQIIGRVQHGDKNVYYDADGVVQEITDTIYTGIPLVAGVEIEEPILYQKLVTKNASVIRTMLNISQLLIQSGMIPDSVTFDGNQNMILRQGTVTVLLGQDEYLEEKIANLVSIYPQVSGETGTLNMEGFTGRNEAITFKTESGSGSSAGGETESAGTPEGGEAAAQSQSEGQAQEQTDAQQADGQQEDGQQAQDAAVAGGDSLAGEGAASEGAAAPEGEDGSQGEEAAAPEEAQEPEQQSTTFMVFDSSGTLRYDARVSGGQVVDSYGNPIPGCRVDENGNAVDAYWNVIDPVTGQLAQ